MEHERHMRRCLELARMALENGEVPVGAVIAEGEKIISEGIECTHALLDPVAHAEVRAIQAACQTLQSSDLSGLTMYSTVEPCVLCGYAVRRSGLRRVVYGIDAGQMGAYTSQYALLRDASLRGWSSPPEVISAILAAECRDLMREFAERSSGE